MATKSVFKRKVSLGFLSLAFAQAVDAAPKDATTAQTAIDEIVVSAQRRTERVQDVPMAVTAITPEFATQSGIRSVIELKYASPGVDINNNTGFIFLNIRGIGSKFVSSGLEGPVAVYVDNTYIPRTNGLNTLLDLVDPGSIEIIRGPQGTLYGRNATGGVIRVNSANPTDKLEGRLAAEYGRFNHSQFDGMLNVPVSDDLSIRFAGRNTMSDGFVKNASGKDLGEVDRYTARTRLKWTPSEDLEVVGGVEWNHSKANGFNDQLGRDDATCYACVLTGATKTSGFYNADVNTVAPYKNRSFRGDLRLSLDRGDYTLTSTTTYFKNSGHQNADNDGIGLDVFRYNVVRQGGKTYGQEFQLSYDGDGTFSYIAAVNYLKDKGYIDFTLEGAAFQFSQTFVGVFPGNNNDVTTDSYSGMLEGVYEFSDTIKLTVGGRYTSDKRKQSVANNAGFQLFGAPAGFGDSDTFKRFTPRVVLAWDNGSTNVYYSYTQGFKAGGFVSPSPFPGRSVDSEKTYGHEIGIKNSALGGQLTTALSVFYYKNKGIQVQVIDINSGGNITENAGSAEGYGAEFELTARPVEGLTLGASAAYLHAEYVSYKNASQTCFDPTGTSNPASPGATLYSCLGDLSNTDVPNAPKLTLSANANYTFPIGDWSGSISGIAQYRSKFLWWAGAGGPLGWDREKAYTEVNFSGYVSPPGEKLRIGFYVDNAFDEQYAAIRTSLNPWGLLYNAAPQRTYGGRIEYSF